MISIGPLPAASGFDTNNINKRILVSSAKRGIEYVVKQQRRSGRIISGEYDLFDIWDTVEAAHAITLWKDEFGFTGDDILASALSFIERHEMSEGMVLQNSGKDSVYCTETSSEYVRLLQKADNRALNQAAREKLAVLRGKQSAAGYWKVGSREVPAELQRFPSVTAYVLRAFAEGAERSLYPEKAYRYLCSSQNLHGHWGIAWHYYGTPFYAMSVIMEVLHANNSGGSYDPQLNRAERYILSMQRKDGSFYYRLKGFENAVSPELHTALALQALLHRTSGQARRALDRGIFWLLRRQKADGSWNGGFFPVPVPEYRKKEDMFCTSAVLILLYNYMDSAGGRTSPAE